MCMLKLNGGWGSSDDWKDRDLCSCSWWMRSCCWSETLHSDRAVNLCSALQNLRRQCTLHWPIAPPAVLLGSLTSVGANMVHDCLYAHWCTSCTCVAANASLPFMHVCLAAACASRTQVTTKCASASMRCRAAKSRCPCMSMARLAGVSNRCESNITAAAMLSPVHELPCVQREILTESPLHQGIRWPTFDNHMEA